MGILVRNNKVISAGGKILYSRIPDPFELPNLKLYLSATRMVQQADESLVPSFADFSGFGYNATQATTGLQPKFKTSQFGANAGILFDGIDDILTFTGGALNIFQNINQFTVMVLAKRSALSVNAPVVQFAQSVGGFSRFVIQFTSGGNIQIAIRMLDSTISAISITSPSNDLNTHLIQCTAISNILYMFVDGVFSGSIAMDSSTSSNTASSAAYVGSLPSTFGSVIINGITVSQSFSSNSVLQAQYRGYLQRGYL